MVVLKVYYGHIFFYCFHFMSFLKEMLREFGFSFCIFAIFAVFFKSHIKVGSSYIKFVVDGAYQFTNPFPVIFVVLFYFIWDYVVQFVICFVGCFYISKYNMCIWKLCCRHWELNGTTCMYEYLSSYPLRHCVWISTCDIQ